MQIMDSADFMEALMDLDNNPDQNIVVGEAQYGHYIESDGSVYTIDGNYVGVLPDSVFQYRLDASGI